MRPGSPKKGTKSVGVARQDTGTAGRIEHCQVGVFLADASPAGYVLVDRGLYLPRCWTDDPAPLAEAGVPDQVTFHPKPQLAQAMLERAVTAGVPAGWVTADTIYGGDRRLRMWLEERAIASVLAVKRTEPLWTWTDHGPGRVAAERLVALVPAEQWLRVSAGQGSKGRRMDDWTRVAWSRYGWPANVGFWLLARRAMDDPKDLAFYACLGPASTPLVELVRVAGVRWAVEETFQQTKARSAWTTTRSAAGPPGIGTSPWRCWHTHSWPWSAPRPPPSMARAKGAVMVTAVGVLVTLTVPEVRRLLASIIWPPPSQPWHVLAWSTWRRRHQARARRAHYQRQRTKLRL